MPVLSKPEVASKPRCIFCIRDDRTPSIEHVMLAGFGRHANIVLPPGASCEPCNNRLGREVDEALVHLPEVQLIRGIWRIPTHRSGTVDGLDIRNGSFAFDEQGALRIEVHSEDDIRVNDNDTITVFVAPTRRRSGDQWRRVARAVLKMGLCLIRHDLGERVALASE